ncbi:D-alanine--D-alanine ligase family protein [Scleromatobacter humisilvae]|uniref:D-alanine--D-alanine ligase n=1 Tax=Scleromatobacter humisilvae TaxID=2897159 RepID=A0A9X1YGD7_9BURK|nr:D-alanine--D-alanine ligase family protein [Scleromatobacter humisilvae]MCK9685553.1 D-alanine--D-alanine ligase [Scleromatobacter humisilvae]
MIAKTQLPLEFATDSGTTLPPVVGLFFGGRSAEHVVSIRSAATLHAALRAAGYRVVPIGIERGGVWRYMPLASDAFHAAVDPRACAVTLAPGRAGQLLPCDGSGEAYDLPRIDVAFPALHGPFGEDGCLQGLFETCGLPYVGVGVLAGAVTMDKEVTKRLLMQAGLPVVPYRLHRRGAPLPTWQALSDSLGPRLYVKPASLGSSIGTAPADDEAAFERALAGALEHGDKVLIERRVIGRELECGVMDTEDGPVASVVGEIRTGTERAFYDYDAKYADDSTAIVDVPARLDAATGQRLRTMAVEAFRATGCRDLARVDFFLGEHGELFINELNTLPGFTSISLYPRMLEASGVPIKDQVTRLVELALARA